MTQTTVYLLDDESELIELLSEVVRQIGLNVRGFTRANQFFEQVEAVTSGSILVLDLHMPGMDGIEVMRQVANMHPAPALILISGRDSSVLHAAEKLGRAHSLEILASLSKPIGLMDFQQLLIEHTPSEPEHQQASVQACKYTVTELLHAIHHDQLTLYYQPQIEISTGKFAGVEALVRWLHPEQGLICPDHFIPFAETNGLMGDLTQWVIGTVIQHEQHWQSMGLTVFVSVNISADNVTTLTLPDYLTQLLASSQLDPTRLTLEVTESALMGELVTSLDILTRLRMKGIGLSIDDFGTGYSSLSQLHKVPFTELKIDRSFVSNMPRDHEAQAIVKTCIMLGHELKMKVVAEGVEDQQTWDILTDLGCDLAQGYFIAKPMPEQDLSAWIMRWNDAHTNR